VAWKRIVNASPLIFLTRLGLLDLLNEPGVEVMVPESVLEELSSQDPDDPAAVAARSTDWIQVVATPSIPESVSAGRLGAGETSVLALALTELETATDEDDIEVVLDDGKARRLAESMGLRM
jgi:predicted nucleic acid-binding protein